MAVSPARRAGIIAGYVVVFCIALPWALVELGRALDQAFRWRAAQSAAGIPLLGAGLWLLLAGMAALWRGGGGLPIGALPPPRFTRRGPFHLARHPIYLGFNLGLAGAGLWLGSPSLTLIVAPGFVPVWISYALLEERGLVRRFGHDYRRYQRQVGLLPRIGLYRLSQVLMWCRVLRWQVEGRRHVPRHGPFILVFNHATFFDPAYLGACLVRPVHFLTTAEAYRRPALRWVVSRFVNIPLRRYRQDVVACREMLRVLSEGGLIGLAVEGERSVWGGYHGALPEVARIVARLGVPAVPVGLSGSYDAGPRWAGRSRRRPVRIRFGPVLRFQDRPATEVIDQGIRGLLDRDPQPVHLDGLDPTALARVLWRCPSCGGEPGWSVAELSCGSCGFRAENTPGGLFRLPGGHEVGLAELGDRVLAMPEPGPLSCTARVSREDDWFGPIRPLRPLGQGQVTIGPDGLDSQWVRIPLGEVSTVSTERADTLQLTTREAMWQVRPDTMSVFRLEAAIRRWRIPARVRGAGLLS